VVTRLLPGLLVPDLIVTELIVTDLIVPGLIVTDLIVPGLLVARRATGNPVTGYHNARPNHSRIAW
jgi:hypothetical protein